MGLRQHRQNRNINNFRDDGDRVYGRNEQLAYTSKLFALEFAKQQARMNHNALECDVREFWYFRRRSSGRICTCMLGDENTPEATCLVCFNTGFVGGYDKYGTVTEIVDAGHPDLVLTNVHPNYDEGTRPVMLVLDDDARVGTIQTTVVLRNSMSSYVDVLRVFSNASVVSDAGGVVDVLCREHGTNTWLNFNTTNVQTIIGTSQSISIDICVYLKRKSVRSPSPVFSHIYMRYGVLPVDQAVLKADIPRTDESISLQEYGFEEQFGTISMFMDNTVKTYGIDDFFYRLDTQKFWKTTAVNPFKTIGIYISFDITARYFQKFEIATQVPV